MAQPVMSGNKLTKTQVLISLAEGSGLDKKAVVAVLDAITTLAKRELGKAGSGELVIPGIVKLKAKDTPATTDREGLHPITKQPTVIKGKPASRKIRATPIKALKDLVATA